MSDRIETRNVFSLTLQNYYVIEFSEILRNEEWFLKKKEKSKGKEKGKSF